MAKKRNKLFVALLVAVLLIVTIIGIISKNNNSVAYSVGNIQNFGSASSFLSNKYLYCLNHGLTYVDYADYYCYETGTVSSETAYVVAQQVDGKRSAENDLIANAIWVLEGEGHSSPPPLQGSAELNELLDKAQLATSITATGNISISGPTSPNIETADGKYGPFKITYPSYNGQVFAITLGGEAQPADTLVITVNGQQLSYTPASGAEFYLTESDGIKYGEENVIEVSYKGYRMASSSYAKFTPKREIIRYGTCEDCGGTFKYTTEGYVANGKAYGISNDMSTWNLDSSSGHNDSECTGTVLVQRTVYYYDDFQNLIYILPMVNKVNETVDTKFWAGKPIIEIELNKINTKNESISNAEFKVTIEGGTLEKAQGSTTSNINGNASCKIVPTKGTNTVRVTLEEISVPEDYVKFTTPIIIEYNWNGSEWVKNIVQLPVGVTEGKSINIDKTATTRQSSNCSDGFKITIVNRPVIKVSLDKKDPQGNTVNVDFNITVEGGTAKKGTIKDGETVIIEPAEGVDTVKVTLTENDPGEEFVQYKVPIEMNFNFDGQGWNLGLYSIPEAPEKVEIVHEENKVTIKAINRRKIIVNLYKTDNGQNPLSGITFNVDVSGGECEDTTITTDSNGYAKILIIPDGVDDVVLKLTEQDDIYYINPGTITIRFVYQGGYWVSNITTEQNVKVGQISINGNIAEFDLEIENIAKIEEVTLLKTNKFFPDEAIEGITFNIELSNAKTLSGATSITRQTDSNGQIELGVLEVLDPNKDITITLKETGVPDTTGLNYRGLYGGTITITLKHRQSGCNVVVTGADSELVEADYDNRQNVVNIQLQNEVTLDLTGKVWVDGQTGLKPVSSPNGIQDSTEKGLANVKVKVERTADSSAPATVNSNSKNTVTDSNGNYEFLDLPASINDRVKYYIEFTYDGINYIATARDQGNDDTIDSDVTEIDRTKFNNRFHTITKDTATSTSGETTSLEYNYDATSAKLITTETNGVVKDKFAMTATTMPTTYSKNTDNIDMGLIKRGVDLAAVTDIYSAKVSINGEEKIYNYNDIQELKKDEYGNPILDPLEQRDIKYNLYLYNSDYNYRIGDYKLGAAHNNELTVNRKNATSNLLSQRRYDGELEIEVTYQTLLNNQSATDATINQIAYYYDIRYTLDGAKPEIVTINGTQYNKVIININQAFDDTNNQGVLNLTFKVTKDAQGNVPLKTMQNWVEIISYSTDEGCIDVDSAPDNIELYNEDDTDDAAGLAIQLNNIEREITGYVFEDQKTTSDPGEYNRGNGLYDNGEKKINDVIVQLIEIKDVKVGNTTLRLEYIWQETVSGSNKVKCVTDDGTGYREYTVSNVDGGYTFKGFVPGNYIVRFIYGDGSVDEYWTTAKDTQKILQYNGQDYKSTVDMYYNKTGYVTTYPQNASMARDNEARRLEEIAYARSISETDVSKLVIDSRDKLADTWMCAETSLVWTDVSEKEQEGDSTNAIKKDVNFGLVERPRANLVLEKHITSLVIDAETRTEAIANFNNYDNAINNGLKVDVHYNGEGVVATATNKEQNQRGLWLVQMEPAKLSGRGIYITYGYRIKNIGDADDIGEKLAEGLSSGKSYAQIASEVKALSSMPGYIPGAYLGTSYYDINGSRAAGDMVSSIPFQVEDYMSTTNGLQLDSTTQFATAVNKTPKPVWTYQSGSADERNAIVLDEEVSVLQSKYILKLYANQSTYSDGETVKLTVYDDHIDSLSGAKEIEYRSYAAQLIYPTSGVKTSDTGTLNKGSILGSLGTQANGSAGTVQSYVHLDKATGGVKLSEIVPEADESIAETVEITLDTGEDKQTPVLLIVSITAGLAVVAIGIVLIKKFIIK